jgi:hypothetical protein
VVFELKLIPSKTAKLLIIKTQLGWDKFTSKLYRHGTGICLTQIHGNAVSNKWWQVPFKFFDWFIFGIQSSKFKSHIGGM